VAVQRLGSGCKERTERVHAYGLKIPHREVGPPFFFFFGFFFSYITLALWKIGGGGRRGNYTLGSYLQVRTPRVFVWPISLSL